MKIHAAHLIPGDVLPAGEVLSATLTPTAMNVVLYSTSLTTLTLSVDTLVDMHPSSEWNLPRRTLQYNKPLAISRLLAAVLTNI